MLTGLRWLSHRDTKSNISISPGMKQGEIEKNNRVNRHPKVR